MTAGPDEGAREARAGAEHADERSALEQDAPRASRHPAGLAGAVVLGAVVGSALSLAMPALSVGVGVGVGSGVGLLVGFARGGRT